MTTPTFSEIASFVTRKSSFDPESDRLVHRCATYIEQRQNTRDQLAALYSLFKFTSIAMYAWNESRPNLGRSNQLQSLMAKHISESNTIFAELEKGLRPGDSAPTFGDGD